MKISFKKFYILLFASFSLNIICFNNANCMQKSVCIEKNIEEKNDGTKINLKEKAENKKNNLKKSTIVKKRNKKKVEKKSGDLGDLKKEDVKLNVKESKKIEVKEQDNKEKKDKKVQENQNDKKIKEQNIQNNKEEKKLSEKKETNEKNIRNNKEEKQNINELKPKNEKTKKSEFENLLEILKDLKSLTGSNCDYEENKGCVDLNGYLAPLNVPGCERMNEALCNKALLCIKDKKGKSVPFQDSLGLNIENDAVYEWSKIFRNIFYNECTLEDFKRFGNLKTIKERDEFLQERFIKIMDKYRGRAYDSKKFEILKLNEIYQFMNEIAEKRYCDVLNDEDMFCLQRFLNDHMVEGFKLTDWISKLRHGYFIFEDEETKIKIVAILYGKGLDNFIFLRKPTEDALEEYRKIKDKDIEREITEDGILIRVDIFSKDLIKSIYPLMKQQYYDEPSNILIIVRDASSYERGRKKSLLDWVDFDHNKYDKIMEGLKENLFNRLYEDNYGDFKLKKPLEEQEPENVVEEKGLTYDIKESDNRKIFTVNGVESKFLAEVTYRLKGDARYKDVFNFDSEGVNKKIEEDRRCVNLRKYMLDKGINYIEFVPQNEKEIFKVKFYGDDEKFFSKDNIEVISNSILSLILKRFFSPDVKNNVSFYEEVKNLNIVLKTYDEYCKDHEKLGKYLDEKESQNCFYCHEAIEFMPKIFEIKKNLVTIPIDCSPNYRGYIPIIPLIIESFGKYKVPFSNKIFDMNNKYIEDYLLRVIENLYDASLNGEKIAKDVIYKSPFDIKVLKNSNID